MYRATWKEHGFRDVKNRPKEKKKATLGCIYNCNLADLAVDTAYHTALCTYSIYASIDVDNEAV